MRAGAIVLLLCLGGVAAKAAADAPSDEIPRPQLEQIYRHAPLTDDLVAALNPELRLDDLAEDAKEIGYPARPA